ncbi:MAG: P-loop NTPase, partial [Gemmatimonadetes bacterium]|nr:P-loop NTPase [Gemmatimonadota bacterium]
VPLLGLIENMASFVCPSCDGESHPFGQGGGAAAASGFEMPFLGSVPLEPAVRAGADEGTPAILAHPDTAASKAVAQIARQVQQQITSAG